MTEPTIIDQQYVSGKALVDYLRGTQELSLLNEAEKNFSKNILLSAASFFESEITETMIQFAKSRSGDDDMMVSIIKQKAISRQYHTYFAWDSAKNANSFFALFGDDFKTKMAARVKKEKDLEESIAAFYQIGAERNKMVHQNFAEIVLDKTAEEIYLLYKKSILFVNTVQSELIKSSPESMLERKVKSPEISCWRRFFSRKTNE